MEEMILEFENVTGSKGKFCLQDISFTLPAGYMMGLMGANGAGKSTLMSYIMREDVKYAGTIKIGGVDIRKNHAYIKNQIGFVSEDHGFFEPLTAMENAKVLSGFYENFDMEKFKETMKEMDVKLNVQYQKLSRGEKLKFQMAFAMAYSPKLYLLDEVTVGMDPVFRLDFYKILQRVIETEEASILMTSHIESEMKQKTDFLGILDEGRMTWFGESPDYGKDM